MNSRLYTNTSNLKGIVGLVLITIATSYASSHATEIVDGTVNTVKNLGSTLSEVMHNGKKQVHVIERHFDGSLHDTGRKLWVRK